MRKTSNVSDRPCVKGQYQPCHSERTRGILGVPGERPLGSDSKDSSRSLGMTAAEPGKFADLFIVRGNPLRDVRNTRHVRTVMKSGVLYDPAELLESAEGKIGGTAGQ